MIFEENIYFEMSQSGAIHYKLPEDKLESLIKKYGNFLSVKITKKINKGTEEQNKAFHSLMTAYYHTGMHSFEGTLEAFKVYLKILHGTCYDMTLKDGRQVRVPKSWSDYTKLERTEMIENVISEINQSGAVTDKKIQEILTGMNEKSLLNA